ncbi:hypothetical protein TNCV_4995211 [Trichonephila clavipes]|nr:hypothetical protein TNCV_4995211 [Trichonephila clavipes]
MYVTIYVTVVPPGGVSFVFLSRASAALFATTDSGPVRMELIFVFPHNQAEFRVAGCPASILFNCFKCFNYFKMTITLQMDVLISSGTILPAEAFNMRSQVSHSGLLISRYSLPNHPTLSPMLLVLLSLCGGV